MRKVFESYNDFINEDKAPDKKLYVLVGPPSIGKSTFITKFNSDDIFVINRDDIVEQVAKKNNLTYDEMFVNPMQNMEVGDTHNLYGEVLEAPKWMTWTDKVFSKIQQLNGQVQQLFNKRVKDAIRSNKDIFVDMTNMNKGSRQKAIDFVKDNSDEYYKIAVVFEFKGSEDIIKKVAKKRADEYKKKGLSKTIKDEVFDMMFDKYTEPTTDEGFDEIIHINTINQLKKLIN